MLFWWICGGESVLPVLLLRHLGSSPPPNYMFIERDSLYVDPHSSKSPVIQGPVIQRENDSLFNKWWSEYWTAACKTITLDPYLTSYTKIISKVIKGLDLKSETIKLLQENIDVKFLAIGLGEDYFLDPTPKVKAKEHKIKWDYIKFRSICTTKHTVN